MLLQLTLPPSLPQGVPLLVAYSGGADSRLLLSLAKAYGNTHDVPVYAAHLHHGIRGEEADRDLAFCRQTTAEEGIPLFEKRVNVPALALGSGQSIETEARAQRYAFFNEVMEKYHLPLLLTAHHADDQLETLLHRFLRGSGTKGMGGIPSLRPLPYGHVFRPLLHLSKEDILSACRELDLDFVTDSTNFQPSATRNRIRAEIIPALESIAGRGTPQQAALRLSRAAAEDEDCLATLAEETYAACRMEEGLSSERITSTHPAISKRVLSIAYKDAAVNLLGTPPDHRHTLSSLHLEQLLTLCRQSSSGASLHLPLLTAYLHKGVLLFRKEEPSSALIPTPLYEGDTLWCEGRILIRLCADSPPPLSDHEALVASARFPANLLPLPLWARTRIPGDIICNHGMHKKLKKILCDKGVPPHLRDVLPLICYGEDMTPLWYPTAAFADGFPSPDTAPAWYIQIIELKNSRKDNTYDKENLCIL